MSDGFAGVDWPPAAHLHVAIDDDGKRHVVQTLRPGRRTSTRVVQGSYEVVQRAVRRSWRVPVTAFWQAHRDAARIYSALVTDWAQAGAGVVHVEGDYARIAEVRPVPVRRLG